MATKNMRWIRRILYAVLGRRRYLALVSGVFLGLVRLRLVDRQYPELFFLRQIVHPGDCCIDIGAHLGYYSVTLSKLCGPRGVVWAVEPIPIFGEVLRRNLARSGSDNVRVLSYALGSKDGSIRMTTPIVEGVFRHGLTHVVDHPAETAAATYEVEMSVPDKLFDSIDRLDFVKCDVEGHEVEVFSHFTTVLDRHRPIVQVEIGSTNNKRQMFDLMTALGYSMFYLERGVLVELTLEKAITVTGRDFYFVQST